MDNKKSYTNHKKKQLGTGEKNNNNIKSQKEKASVKSSITEWFYMTPSEIDAKMISDFLKENKNIEVELWAEMNILQIELSNKATIDFEWIECRFKDPSDAAFIKNRNIKTIFAITIDPEAVEDLKEIASLLIGKWEGFLCADSADFQPLYDK